jgi:hypothetical protein
MSATDSDDAAAPLQYRIPFRHLLVQLRFTNVYDVKFYLSLRTHQHLPSHIPRQPMC